MFRQILLSGLGLLLICPLRERASQRPEPRELIVKVKTVALLAVPSTLDGPE
jgi:glucose dehydrogenase